MIRTKFRHLRAGDIVALMCVIQRWTPRLLKSLQLEACAAGCRTNLVTLHAKGLRSWFSECLQLTPMPQTLSPFKASVCTTGLICQLRRHLAQHEGYEPVGLPNAQWYQFSPWLTKWRKQTMKLNPNPIFSSDGKFAHLRLSALFFSIPS